jgi:hypothetical protein
MQKWARIHNGSVAEIIDSDPTGRYHPALFWVGVPIEETEVACGWTWTEQDGFAPPVSPPPATDEQKARSLINRAQRILDTFAQTRGYDSILSAATYTASYDPQYKMEGEYAAKARDEVWSAVFQVIEDAKAGKRPWPVCKTFEQEELPQLKWPESA